METRWNTFFWLTRHYFLVIRGPMTKSDKFINFFSIAINATFHKGMELVGKKIDFEILSLSKRFYRD